MSCFWDTLQKTNLFNVSSSKDIIKFIKKNNKKINCIVNGQNLTVKQMDENYEAINNIKEITYRSGYLTSMCEPVLCFIVCFFNVHIVHEWQLEKKYIITYSPINELNKEKTIFVIHSNRGHAKFIKVIKVP